METPLRILAPIALLALSATSLAQVAYNGHLYSLTPAATTWTGAEAYAASVGGHLATVNDAAENAFLVSLVAADENRPYWLGLNDAATEGAYVWSSGETPAFARWHAGEPGTAFGEGDYTTINWYFAHGVSSDRGGWKLTPDEGTNLTNSNANGPYRGIVEVAPVPEPATFVAFGMGALALVRRGRRV